MTYKCILFTGANGKVAKQVRPHLAGICDELRLVDINRPEPILGNETVHVADLNDANALERLLTGVDAIIHFAGYPREASWPVLMEANILAVARLWEAAVAAGVKRILYASSNHATGYYPRSEKIGHQALPRPDSRYGVTKVFMEALASMHADKSGLRAMGIRIGYCGDEPKDARMLSHWVHPEDLASLVKVGLAAEYHNEIVYGVSANSATWYDNERAAMLGYLPRHSADRFTGALAAVRTDNVIAEMYQGGDFAADGHASLADRRLRSASRNQIESKDESR